MLLYPCRGTKGGDEMDRRPGKQGFFNVAYPGVPIRGS